MRIGIVHRADVADVRQRSGSPHFIGKALQKHVGDVTFLGPDHSSVTRGIEYAGKALNRVVRATSGRGFSTEHHGMLTNRLASTFGKMVEASGCDVIFAPVASAEIAGLSTSKPIVYMTDIVWASILDYYPPHTGLLQYSRKAGERIEAAAISKSRALIFPSAWTANVAIDHYGAARERIHVLPFGANFAEGDTPTRDVALQHSLKDGIGLLWVGVDWERKGGRIAHACLLELLARGQDARLVVCGCVPPEKFRHPRIEVIPFLNKRDPVQRRELSELFLRANFLLFPTMAEAFGIVVSEASAHGLPTLARNTGGVGGAVSDGKNGFLLSPDATGKDYAERVLELVQDAVVYNSLVMTSRDAFETRLNWDAWATAAKPIFESCLIVE